MSTRRKIPNEETLKAIDDVENNRDLEEVTIEELFGGKVDENDNPETK